MSGQQEYECPKCHFVFESLEVPVKCSNCDYDWPELSEIVNLKQQLAALERENAELVKFITACSEDRYARVACLEWVRKHKPCSKP